MLGGVHALPAPSIVIQKLSTSWRSTKISNGRADLPGYCRRYSARLARDGWPLAFEARPKKSPFAGLVVAAVWLDSDEDGIDLSESSWIIALHDPTLFCRVVFIEDTEIDSLLPVCATRTPSLEDIGARSKIKNPSSHAAQSDSRARKGCRTPIILYGRVILIVKQRVKNPASQNKNQNLFQAFLRGKGDHVRRFALTRLRIANHVRKRSVPRLSSSHAPEPFLLTAQNLHYLLIRYLLVVAVIFIRSHRARPNSFCPRQADNQCRAV